MHWLYWSLQAEEQALEQLPRGNDEHLVESGSVYNLNGFCAKSLLRSLQVRDGMSMPPTELPGPYPQYELLGCVQMPVGVGIGHLVDVVAVLVGVVVVLHGMVMVEVVGLPPPEGGFLLRQSDLLLPPALQ